MKFHREDVIVLALVVGMFIGTVVLRVPSDELYESQPRVVPPKVLNHAHFGFKLVIADSLWLRVLQSDDFCESPKPKALLNMAMLLEDALKTPMTPSRCDKGWVYKMFDLITDLNPQFKWVYKMGGVMLSIGVDDREGARLIFEKGITNFGDDWQLLYRAAYHYIFEVQDAQRAAQILTMASKLPDVPAIIPVLAARLQNVQGRYEIAESTLLEYLKTAKPGSEGHAHATLRLKQLRKIMADKKDQDLKKKSP